MGILNRTYPLKEIPQEFLMKQGELCHVLSDFIEQYDIDFLVLGAHGRHRLKKLILGSAAEGLFRTAAYPVSTAGSCTFRCEVRKLREHSLRHGFLASLLACTVLCIVNRGGESSSPDPAASDLARSFPALPKSGSRYTEPAESASSLGDGGLVQTGIPGAVWLPQRWHPACRAKIQGGSDCHGSAAHECSQNSCTFALHNRR